MKNIMKKTILTLALTAALSGLTASAGTITVKGSDTLVILAWWLGHRLCRAPDTVHRHLRCFAQDQGEGNRSLHQDLRQAPD